MSQAGRKKKKELIFLLNQASSSTQLDLLIHINVVVMELSAVVRRYLYQLLLSVSSFKIFHFYFIFKLKKNFFVCTMGHVVSQSPDKGSNPMPPALAAWTVNHGPPGKFSLSI